MSQAEIIAALMVPIPVAHLWLHALHPFWRKHPLSFYFLGFLFFVGGIIFIPLVASISPHIFFPPTTVQWAGYGLMVLGLILALSSFFTLGWKRFLVWTVLRPEPHAKTRVYAGPFQFLPHPAYTGYLLVAMGNLLTHGQLYLVGILIYALILFPLVIWLEEREMKERLTV